MFIILPLALHTAPEKSGPYRLVSYLAVVICVASNRAPLEIIAGKYNFPINNESIDFQFCSRNHVPIDSLDLFQWHQAWQYWPASSLSGNSRSL